MSTRPNLQTNFLPTGSYFVTNVRHGVSLSLCDDRNELCGRPERMTWTIVNINGNTKWHILGGRHPRFANVTPCPRSGDIIKASKDPFEWDIRQCGSPDCYIIYTNFDECTYLWCLQDGEEQTTVTLSTGRGTDKKTLWKFQPIPDGGEDQLGSPLDAYLPRLPVEGTTRSARSPPAIIAVMGATGAGKSSFINTVAKNHELVVVGHTMDSCTKEIQEVHLKWGEEQIPVVLVDTPGFNDSSMSDTEVLRRIARYLETSHKAGTKLTGVVYMHRIQDPVEQNTIRNFEMFRKLCGSKQLQQVVIVTTCWDIVAEEDAREREQKLCEDRKCFKPMLDYHAHMMRHDRRHNGAFSSARAVLDHLLRHDAMDLKIQTQLVKEKRSLPFTDAGSVINTDLMGEARRCHDRFAAVQEELKNTKDVARRQSLEQERRALQEERKRIRRQIDTLSKTLNKHSLLWRIISAIGFWSFSTTFG